MVGAEGRAGSDVALSLDVRGDQERAAVMLLVAGVEERVPEFAARDVAVVADGRLIDTRSFGDANLLPDNPNVALEISEYNKLQTKRNAMVANSNDQNPLVLDLDVQLKGMREAIVNSLDQGIAQLKAQQKGVSIDDQKLKDEMAAAPGKITKILPAERKHKIVEALYIYLLEKREENNITQVFNAKNIRLVSPPLGKLKPVFPKKGVTILLSLLLGILIPMLVIYTRRNVKAILAEE